MKTILSLRKHLYLKRAGIFLIVIALVAVMVACNGGGGGAQYDLTMAANPAAGGTATDLTNASPYTADTAVSIKAVANQGYQFVNWTAPAGGFTNANAAQTSFTMPAQAVTVTANFEPSEFYGGSGTEGDPYQIADWHHLHNVRNYLDSYFILVNDLDSTTAGYTERASPTANGGNGWQPIVSLEVDPFAGTFDGQGYEIRDLFINRPDDENYVGLFGAVDVGGVIENVEMVDADVTGNLGVGILVGGSAGTVSSSYSSGSVSGSDGVGGLMGGNGGSISDSYSTASVTGYDEYSTAVGGLVGANDGGDASVSNSYATGSVTGYTEVGGLVGWNDYGTVVNCYSTGSVTGNATVGGLVGYNTGDVSNSYATGSVTGGTVGGLVGCNNGAVDSCYSTGSVTGGTVGGLVGYNFFGTVSNSFWDTETSGQATSDGGTGKTTAEMKDIDTFTDTETEGLDEPWDIIAVVNSSTRNTGYIWNIVDDVTYPFLSWQPV